MRVALITLAALALASCSRGGEYVSVGLDGSIKIWTDKDTGCQYVITDDNITPRLGVPCPSR